MKIVRADEPGENAGVGRAVAQAPSAPVLSITTVAFALMVYGLVTAVTIAYQLGRAALS